ncbi:hypothetical protein [Mesorhizobium sp.]|uniref:hypothetical protein n=1 Tax=Mesorhizobium sp. TaxID=1871066 RepID=UPI00257BA437|nr:hypothetical protein [Mesorhizobium sp.]
MQSISRRSFLMGIPAVGAAVPVASLPAVALSANSGRPRVSIDELLNNLTPEVAAELREQVHAMIEQAVARHAQPMDSDSWKDVQGPIKVAAWGFHAAETGANNTAILQSAVDLVIYGVLNAPIELPPGASIPVSGRLFFGYGNTFHNATLRGQGKRYRGTLSNGSGTGLLHTGTAHFINIQSGRGVSMNDFTVAGDKAASYAAIISAASETILDEATWTAVGGNDRFSPHCGISIDAYIGDSPVSPYPAYTPPEWTGATGGYTKTSSTMTSFDGVEVIGFNTAFGNSLGDAASNGDFSSWNKCRVEDCKYAWSVGGTQSRTIEIKNSQAARVHTVFTNYKHGELSGRYGGLISNVSVGCAVQIVDFAGSAFLAGMAISNLYGESMWRMGNISSAASYEYPIRWSGGLQSYLWQDTYGSPGWFLEGTTMAEITLSQIAFTLVPSVLTFRPDNTVIDKCVLNQTARDDTITNLYEAYAHNALGGGFVVGCWNSAQNIKEQNPVFRPVNVETGVLETIRALQSDYTLTTREYCLPIYLRRFRPASEPMGAAYTRGVPSQSIAKSSLSSMTRSGRLITMVHTSLSDARALDRGWNPGNILVDLASGTVLFIYSRIGTTVKAIMQNNYKVSDEDESFTTFDLAAGTMNILNANIFALPFTTTGTVTSGSAVITGVTNLAGSSAHISAIQVGDFYMGWSNTGLFSETNSVVTAVDTGAGTITLTGNATRSASNVDLMLWSRPGPANIVL